MVTTRVPRPLVPMLGLRCSAASSQGAPNDTTVDRIEDVIAANTALGDDYRIIDLVECVAPRWSRNDLMGALVDATVAGWLTTKRVGNYTCIQRIDEPPEAVSDDLATQLRAMRVRARVEQIDRDITLLVESLNSVRGEEDDLTHAARNARSAMRYLLRRVDF